MKRHRRSRFKKMLRVNEKVENNISRTQVRSQGVGLLGSWHQGIVLSCGHRRRCIKYDHILIEDGLEKLIDYVEVPPAVDGVDSNEVHQCHYRGSIRPLPPHFATGPWDLPYGMCVDVYYMEAWWEGVIFDHNDGAEERTVFFPDQGDEMLAELGSIRITMTWNKAVKGGIDVDFGCSLR
ncbi:hypothetical protein CDL15_Pgr011135 [Punica granatum]|uniref:Agenet-like domain-containing protein n=1 Tax=Punica granatum TaxID=22663 RepID=A0A218XP91_PUNGR|nr:hypothetical protein CDL15_Pgr011135 [Punica granatum]